MIISAKSLTKCKPGVPAHLEMMLQRLLYQWRLVLFPPGYDACGTKSKSTFRLRDGSVAQWFVGFTLTVIPGHFAWELTRFSYVKAHAFKAKLITHQWFPVAFGMQIVIH